LPRAQEAIRLRSERIRDLVAHDDIVAAAGHGGSNCLVSI
jgi:hypothetical protein